MGKRTSEHLSSESSQPAKKKKKISSSTEASGEAQKDTPFPRGGKSVLSSLEKRKIHQQVKQDLFSGASSSPGKEKPKKKSKPTPRKKTKKSKSKTDDAPAEETDDSIEGILQRLDRDAPSQAHPITFHVGLSPSLSPRDPSLTLI